MAPGVKRAVVAGPRRGGYRMALPMSDRVFFPLAALIALAMIALSLVWPQGLGAPSPAPFGHPLAPLHPPAAKRAAPPAAPEASGE